MIRFNRHCRYINSLHRQKYTPAAVYETKLSDEELTTFVEANNAEKASKCFEPLYQSRGSSTCSGGGPDTCVHQFLIKANKTTRRKIRLESPTFSRG